MFLKKHHKNKTLLNFLMFIILAQFAGLLGSIFTTPNIRIWYDTLNKPNLNPPNWLFAPVWTILFLLMGISSYLIFTAKDKNRRIAMKLYFSQLILNIVWSIIFFAMRSPQFALVEIIILWVFILATISSFYKVKKIAGILFIPYILWVSFAMYLNYQIFILN